MGGQCHTCGRRNRSGKNQASASPSPVAERFRHDVIDQRLRQPREFELLEDRDQECVNLLLEIDPDLLRREAETARDRGFGATCALDHVESKIVRAQLPPGASGSRLRSGATIFMAPRKGPADLCTATAWRDRAVSNTRSPNGNAAYSVDRE